jgi:hypothetical protein
MWISLISTYIHYNFVYITDRKVHWLVMKILFVVQQLQFIAFACPYSTVMLMYDTKDFQTIP